MKARGFRDQTARVAMVNCDYEIAKREAGNSQRVTVRSHERLFNLKAGQLVNWRSNVVRKKTPIPEL